MRTGARDEANSRLSQFGELPKNYVCERNITECESSH